MFLHLGQEPRMGLLGTRWHGPWQPWHLSNPEAHLLPGTWHRLNKYDGINKPPLQNSGHLTEGSSSSGKQVLCLLRASNHGNNMLLIPVSLCVKLKWNLVRYGRYTKMWGIYTCSFSLKMCYPLFAKDIYTKAFMGEIICCTESTLK